jgi:hypothetical protein
MNSRGPTPHFSSAEQTPHSILEGLKSHNLSFKKKNRPDFVSMFKVSNVIREQDPEPLQWREDFRKSETNFSRIIHPQLKVKSLSRLRQTSKQLFFSLSKYQTEPDTEVNAIPPVPIHSKTFTSNRPPRRLNTLINKQFTSSSTLLLINSESYMKIST